MTRRAPRRLSNRAGASFEASVRAQWGACVTAGVDEAAIERALLCSRGDAFRLATFRRAATEAIVALWLLDALTFREAFRIAVLDAPFDAERQLELARHYATAKALIDAPGGPFAKQA